MDGTVQCWGYNLGGQLGDGTTVNRLLAAPVPTLSSVAEVKHIHDASFSMNRVML